MIARSLTTAVIARTALVWLALVVVGCPKPATPPPKQHNDPSTSFAVSTKNELAWKRQRAVQTDLAAALELQTGELCKELGRFSCIDSVHQVALGGNDAFVKGQYEPLPAPTVTTPIALERVVLSACTARADKDIAAPAVVFTDLDFSAPSVSDAAANATVSTLFERFLARTVTASERTSLLALTQDDDGGAVAPRDFAILACTAVGTLTENFFQ